MFGAVAEASCIVYTFLNIYDWNSFNVLILQLQEASEVVSYKDSDVNSADAGPIEWDRNQVVLICLILSYWHSMHMTCSVHNYINTSDCMRQEKCQSAKDKMSMGWSWKLTDIRWCWCLLSDAIYRQNSVLLQQFWKLDVSFSFRKNYVVVNYICYWGMWNSQLKF